MFIQFPEVVNYKQPLILIWSPWFNKNLIIHEIVPYNDDFPHMVRLLCFYVFAH
jgi:hypothetical protein